MRGNDGMLPEEFDLLVLGLGKTGLAVAEWAADHLGGRVRSACLYGGAKAAPSDRTRALEERGVRCVLGTEEVEGAFDVCVASPGISEFSDFFASARAHASEIMGEPEFAYRLSPDRWIAVTGTNGKTTTTSLVDHILNASGMSSHAVGNIGSVPTAAVDAREPGSWFAAELSSYQLACSSLLHPRVSVLLNITPDHLAWHRSLEAYAAAKRRIFARQEPGDLVIVCVEDAGSAAAAALWVGAPLSAVRRALTTFQPLEHRIEPVAVVDGVRYVNDSKATNTDAVEKALTAFPSEPVVLLLGGSDKGTPLEAFAERVAASTVRTVICFGDARARLLAALEGPAGASGVELMEAADLAAAVSTAHGCARPGDVVLLSPACASFDEFSGFEERGRRFKELVADLAARG